MYFTLYQIHETIVRGIKKKQKEKKQKINKVQKTFCENCSMKDRVERQRVSKYVPGIFCPPLTGFYRGFVSIPRYKARYCRPLLLILATLGVFKGAPVQEDATLKHSMFISLGNSLTYAVKRRYTF